MATTITGTDLGLVNSSLSVLGPEGGLGSAIEGRTKEGVYVNASTGNLVVQHQDEVLLGVGPDIGILRTYNSQGLLDDDNADNWRIGYYRKVFGLTGTVNTAGSTIRRQSGDGAESLFTFDSGLGKYVSTDGGGAFDTLSYNTATHTWTFTDGDTQGVERYSGTGVGSNGARLVSLHDPDGNTITLTYNGSGLITQVEDANGESTFLDYTGDQLTQIRTVAGSTTLIRTHYTYDSNNRLKEVITDLSPTDQNITDGKVYKTTYTYEGTSTRLAALTQTDGTAITFTYTQVGGQYRVKTVTDALGRITSYDYDPSTGTITVTDPSRAQWLLQYDSVGQLAAVHAPPIDGVAAITVYAYDPAGNLTSVTDPRGHQVVYQYDANGNRILSRDSLGNTVTRTYSTTNELLTETRYVTPDPDGAGPSLPQDPQTTRFVYDNERHLRFRISGAGEVTEYRYNSVGQNVATITYNATRYDLTGLTPTDPLTEATLNNWVSTSADKTDITRTDATYDVRGQVSRTTTYGTIDTQGQGVSDGKEKITDFVYDQAGNLLKTIDTRGIATPAAGDYETTFTYDGLNRLLTTTQWLSDTATRTTVTTYDDSGKTIATTLADGLIQTSVFNNAGELISLNERATPTGPVLSETKFFYDKNSRLRRVEDPNNLQTHTLYDDRGREIATLDPDGTLTEFIYNDTNQVTKTITYANRVSASVRATLINPDNTPANVDLATIRPVASSDDRITYQAYDDANRLVKTVDAEGYVSEVIYNSRSEAIETIRYANAIDTSGLTDTPAPEAITPALDPAKDRHTRTFFDSAGRQIGQLDAEGYLTEWQYDAGSRMIGTVAYATQAPVSTASNATLRQSGSFDELKSAIGTDANDIATHTLYNKRNEVVAQVNGEGELTEIVYDAAGNRTSQIAYHTRVTYTGQPLAQLRPASHPEDQVQTWEYDGANRMVRQRDPDGTITSFDYDALDRLVSTSRAEGTSEVRTLTTRYDIKGRVIAELTPQGSALLTGNLTQAEIDQVWNDYSVKHTYDANDWKTSTTDQNGLRTLFFYDEDGRVTHTVNALGEVQAVTYDAFGQAVETIQYGTRLSDPAALTGGLLTQATKNLFTALASLNDSTTQTTYTKRGQMATWRDAEGFKTTETYNAFGEMATKSEELAKTPLAKTLEHIYQYDRRGLQTNIVWDPTGVNRTAQTQYDAFGRAIETTDGLGHKRTQHYDRAGRVVEIRDALNKPSFITYDALGRTLTQTDRLGRPTTFDYNTQTRSMTVTTAEGIQTTQVNNRHGQTLSITDGRSHTTSFEYDKNGNLLKTTAPENIITEATYDRANRVIDSIDPNGVVTRVTYDDANRVLTTTLDPTTLNTANDNPDGLNLTSTIEYDARGWVIKATDANGIVTTTQYDKKGEAIAITVDPQGLNRRTEISYDGAGRQLRVTTGAGTPDAKVVAYVYDALGRRIEEHRDPEGLDLTTKFIYDKEGNLTQRLGADGAVTMFFYDKENRLVTTIFPQVGGALSYVSTTYDAAGQARSSMRANNLKTHTLYDADGRVIATLDADGTLTEFIYNDTNQVTKTITYANRLTQAVRNTLTNANGTPANVDLATIRPTASTDDRITYNAYDDANRLVKTVDQEGYVTEIVYNARSEVVKTIAYAKALSASALAALGNTPAPSAINPTLDAANDRVTRTFFDSAGRQIGVLDAEGYLTEWNYDAGSRMIGTVQYATAVAANLRASGSFDQLKASAGTNANDITTHILYNKRNEVVAQVNGEGELTEIVYDANGNRTQSIAYHTRVNYTGQPVNQLRPASHPEDQVQTWAYDGANRMVRQTDPDGTVTTLEYDPLDRLTKASRAEGTTEVRTLTTRYDAKGRVIAELTPQGSALLTGNLTQAEIDQVWEDYSLKHTYDANDWKTSTTDQNGLKTLFFYDEDGRLTHTVNAAGEVQATTYDAFGQAIETRAYVTRIAPTTLNTLTGGLLTQSVKDIFTALASVNDSTTQTTYTRRGQMATWRDAEGFTTTETYNAFGEMATKSEELAKTPLAKTLEHIYQYDRRGLQTNIVWDPTGVNRTAQTQYDAFGRAIATTDSLNHKRTQAYDRTGRVVTVTDALNNSATTTYDALGRTLTQTDSLNRTTTYQYNTKDRSLTVTTPEQITTTTTQNRHGQTLSITDGRGHTTSYEYDKNGNLTKTTAPEGITTEATYDRANRVIDQIDANGITTRSDYDSANRVLTVTLDPKTLATTNDNPDGLNLVTSFEYDAKGERITATDANGIVTETEFDKKGQTVRTTLDPGGLNIKTAFTYDGAGRTLSVTEGEGSPAARLTQYVYDALGRRIEEHVAPFRLNLTTKFEYDKEGNVTRKNDANGHATRFAYDADNRLIFTINPLGGVTETVYDADGRVTQTIAHTIALTASDLASLPPAPSVNDVTSRLLTDANDQVTTTVYDADGRARYTIDANRIVTARDLDANGNVTRTVTYALALPAGTALTPEAIGAALTPSVFDRQTRNSFDAANRLRYTIDALGYVTETQYDGVARVTKTTRYATPVGLANLPAPTPLQVALNINNIADAAKDQTDTFSFDAAGRLISSTDAMGSSESYTYDEVGNKTSFTNKKGATWDYEYDNARRLTLERTPQVQVATLTDVTAGNLDTVLPSATGETPQRLETGFEYDALGNLTAKREYLDPFRAYARETRYVYDAAGRQVKTTLPALTVYDSATDDLATNGITGTVNRTETDATPEINVTFDALGQAVVNKDQLGNYSYKVYDPLGRLTYEIDAEAYLTEFRYDTYGNQTKIIRYANKLNVGAVTGYAAHHAPDPFTAAEVKARLTPDNTKDRTITQEYDQLNRRVKITEPATWVYDSTPAAANANATLLSAGRTHENLYNAFGQVIRQRELLNPSVPSYADTYFYYNARGEKTAQVDALGYLTTFQYDETGDLIKQVEYAKALPPGSWTVFGYGATPIATTPQNSPNSAIGYDREIRFTYDRLNRKIREIRVNVEYSSTDGTTLSTATGDLKTTFDYDRVGNLVRTTDASGAAVYTYYDALGRTTAVAEPTRAIGGLYPNATQTPLTEYKLDVFGRTIAEIHYAKSATVNLLNHSTPAAAAGDQITYRFYDLHNNVRRTIDPEGASSYASFDAADRLVKQWQPITDNDGRIENAIALHGYDKLGREVSTTTPAFLPNKGDGSAIDLASEALTRAIRYNSFGEVIARGTSAGTSAGAVLQEYFDYDQAGNLWRTNQDDGVTKILLYNLQGQASAKFTHATQDLKHYTDALDFLFGGGSAGAVREDTTYDSLGRAIQKTLPAVTGEAAAALPAVSPHDADVTVLPRVISTTVANPSDPNRITVDAMNEVRLTFGSGIADYGSGDVKVELEYFPAVSSLPSGQFPTQTQTLAWDPAGVTLRWSDTPGSGVQGIYAVHNITIYRRDSQGNFVKVDRRPNTSPYPYFNNPDDTPAAREAAAHWLAAPTNDAVTLRYRLTGTSAWTEIPVARFHFSPTLDLYNLSASALTFSVPSGQISASYALDYEILYTPAGGTPIRHDHGSLVYGAGGSLLQFTPAPLGRPVITQTLDRWGNALSVSDPRDETAVTRNRYNQANQAIETIAPTVEVTDEQGVTRATNPITRTYYDLLGREIATTDANGHTATKRYDAAGQLVQEYFPDGGTKGYVYDLFGNKLWDVDPLSNVTFSSYDRDNRLVRVERPLEANTYGLEQYRYDEAGHRLQVTNALGDTTRYKFDTAGRVLRTETPGGFVTERRYDLLGHKISEADGATSTSSYNYFGRLTAHTDQGGASYSYQYNNLGQLTTQSNTRGQNLAYAYYANGALKSITDNAKNAETYYEYDQAGNRVRERYTEGGIVYRDTRTTYDALNRSTIVSDPQFIESFAYDAVGNRRAVRTNFNTNAPGAVLSFTRSYYLYDSMNRITLSQGVLENGVIHIQADTPGGTNLQRAQGVKLTYDLAGNRKTMQTYEGTTLVNETYDYDRAHRLTTTSRAGSPTSSRTYDALDRVTELVNYSSPGVVRERRTSVYNAATERLDRLEIKDGAGNPTQTSTYTYSNDAEANLLASEVVVRGPKNYTNNFTYQYVHFETAKQSLIDGHSTYLRDGQTTTTYDANGNLIHSHDLFNTDHDQAFIVGVDGLILKKTEGTQNQYYYYVNGKPIGSSGALSPADFDFNYTPVSDQYPLVTPSTYTVSEGDTLRSIALAVYGDAQLWFLIADANGLSTDADLTVGVQLHIPNRITNLRNSAETFKPYNPGEVIGDLTPTFAGPKHSGGGGCGGAAIIIAIVAVLAAVLFPVLLTAIGVGGTGAGAAAGTVAGAVGTGAGAAAGGGGFFGALAAGAGALQSAGAAVLGAFTGASSIPAGLAGAAVLGGSAAAGNLVSQGLSIAAGLQQGFNTRAFGEGLLTGIVGGPLGALGGVAGEALGGIGGALIGGTAHAVVAGAQYGEFAGQVVGQVAGTQGVGILTGQRKGFKFNEVAGALIASTVLRTPAVGRALNSVGNGIKATANFLGAGDKTAAYLARTGVGFLQQTGRQVINAVLPGGGGFKNVALTGDGVGNVLGNSFVDVAVEAGEQAAKQREAQSARAQAAVLKSIGRDDASLDRRLAGIFNKSDNLFDASLFGDDPSTLLARYGDPADRAAPTLYAAQSGDTYEGIAGAKLGAGASYEDIQRYAAQLITLNPGDPRALQPNANLRLPSANTPITNDAIDVLTRDIRLTETQRTERRAPLAPANEFDARVAASGLNSTPADPNFFEGRNSSPANLTLRDVFEAQPPAFQPPSDAAQIVLGGLLRLGYDAASPYIDRALGVAGAIGDIGQSFSDAFSPRKALEAGTSSLLRSAAKASFAMQMAQNPFADREEIRRGVADIAQDPAIERGVHVAANALNLDARVFGSALTKFGLQLAAAAGPGLGLLDGAPAVRDPDQIVSDLATARALGPAIDDGFGIAEAAKHYGPAEAAFNARLFAVPQVLGSAFAMAGTAYLTAQSGFSALPLTGPALGVEADQLQSGVRSFLGGKTVNPYLLDQTIEYGKSHGFSETASNVAYTVGAGVLESGAVFANRFASGLSELGTNARAFGSNVLEINRIAKLVEAERAGDTTLHFAYQGRVIASQTFEGTGGIDLFLTQSADGRFTSAPGLGTGLRIARARDRLSETFANLGQSFRRGQEWYRTSRLADETGAILPGPRVEFAQELRRIESLDTAARAQIDEIAAFNRAYRQERSYPDLTVDQLLDGVDVLDSPAQARAYIAERGGIDDAELRTVVDLNRNKAYVLNGVNHDDFLTRGIPGLSVYSEGVVEGGVGYGGMATATYNLRPTTSQPLAASVDQAFTDRYAAGVRHLFGYDLSVIALGPDSRFTNFRLPPIGGGSGNEGVRSFDAIRGGSGGPSGVPVPVRTTNRQELRQLPELQARTVDIHQHVGTRVHEADGRVREIGFTGYNRYDHGDIALEDFLDTQGPDTVHLLSPIPQALDAGCCPVQPYYINRNVDAEGVVIAGPQGIAPRAAQLLPGRRIRIPELLRFEKFDGAGGRFEPGLYGALESGFSNTRLPIFPESGSVTVGVNVIPDATLGFEGVARQRDAIDYLGGVLKRRPDLVERAPLGITSVSPRTPGGREEILNVLAYAVQEEAAGRIRRPRFVGLGEVNHFDAKEVVEGLVTRGQLPGYNASNAYDYLRFLNDEVGGGIAIVHADAGRSIEVALLDASGKIHPNRLLIHGETEYSNIDRLVELANQHPNVNFIHAHAGGLSRSGFPGTWQGVGEHTDVMRYVLQRTNNIWYDMSWGTVAEKVVAANRRTGAWAGPGGTGIMNEFPDRFLFGTDEIGQNLANYIGPLRQYFDGGLIGNLRDPEAFLRGNALDLLESSARKFDDYIEANREALLQRHLSGGWRREMSSARAPAEPGLLRRFLEEEDGWFDPGALFKGVRDFFRGRRVPIDPTRQYGSSPFSVVRAEKPYGIDNIYWRQGETGGGASGSFLGGPASTYGYVGPTYFDTRFPYILEPYARGPQATYNMGGGYLNLGLVTEGKSRGYFAYGYNGVPGVGFGNFSVGGNVEATGARYFRTHADGLGARSLGTIRLRDPSTYLQYWKTSLSSIAQAEAGVTVGLGRRGFQLNARLGAEVALLDLNTTVYSHTFNTGLFDTTIYAIGDIALGGVGGNIGVHLGANLNEGIQFGFSAGAFPGIGARGKFVFGISPNDTTRRVATATRPYALPALGVGAAGAAAYYLYDQARDR